MRTGVIRICKYCGKSFKAHRTSSVGKYCSRDCVNKSMKVQDIKVCDYCGKSVIRRKSAFYRNGYKKVFCNHSCSGKWRSEHRKSYRFSGGSVEKRKNIFGNSCVICGFNRYVELTHIISVKSGGTTSKLNIIPLCPTHHSLYDNDLLNKEEQIIMDNFIIIAWSSTESIK